MTLSAPYCTSGNVYFMRLYMSDPRGTDYEVGGIPSKDVVEFWIAQIAAQIDAAYYAVGYNIPFTEVSGETWPSWQTTFLRYFNSIGVASLMGGDTSTGPVVEFIGGRRQQRSFYEAEWMRLTEAVRAIGQRQPSDALIRAANRAGSEADYLLSQVSPPLSDFLEGYVDPTLHDKLREFTQRSQYYSEYQNQYNLPSVENASSIEYMWFLHQRLGLTYDQ